MENKLISPSDSAVVRVMRPTATKVAMPPSTGFSAFEPKGLNAGTVRAAESELPKIYDYEGPY